MLACFGGDVSLVNVIGLLVSGIGLVVAVVAAWYAKRAVDTADKQFQLAKEEHEAWMHERNKHPELGIEVHVPRANDGQFVTDATSTSFRIAIGLWNSGDLAAGQTIVHLLAPKFLSANLLTAIRWSGQNGEDLNKDLYSPPADTAETVTDSDGNELEVNYLFHTIETIGMTARPVMFATASINTPPGTEPIKVPLIARATCDGSPPAEMMIEIIFKPKGYDDTATVAS